MVKKIKQFFYDMADLHNGVKCPNDFPFWYFMILQFPLDMFTLILILLIFSNRCY